MQLSKLNLALTRIGKASFSPKSLFSSGAQGAWYDPSDLATLYEDSAGTIPITSPLEKPVGLMLDKSKGLVLGSELVTNGTFDTDVSGWTAASDATLPTISWSSGSLRLSGSTYVVSAYRAISVVAETWYQVKGDISYVSGTADAYLQIRDSPTISSGTLFGNSSSVSSVANSGTRKLTFKATSTGTLYIHLRMGGATVLNPVFDFDNISVRELPGNHATQSTTTSRPTLSARVNLLTKTEQFDDAAWNAGGRVGELTPNQTAAPDGTVTAELFTAKDSYGGFSQSVTLPVADYVFTIRLKAFAGIPLPSIDVDLNWGSPSKNGAFSLISDSNLGDGWIERKWSVSLTSSATRNFGLLLTGLTSNVTKLYIWGADLRVANDGIGLPAYQRVDTATDYDYAGFPPYLKFDGTDDGMATGNIDFTGTNKMSVFAGVRKLSDASGQFISEFSADISANNGSFNVVVPNTSPYQNFGFRSKGTTLVLADVTSNAYAAPTTNILTGLGDISGDSAILRVNGTQAASSTADQGTGNYGNYPLYIGRRGGTTLPFNGRLYSLVVCGKLASAAEISSTEAYINNKTKAY